MNKIATFLGVVLLAVAGVAQASGGSGLRLDPAPIHRLDAESLQRGARNFVNYCLNCHSAKYMRYEGLKDIGLSDQQIMDNLMFGTDKLGSTMTVAMTRDEARDWFGAIPPDLSVESRVRGNDWLYSYLLAFYKDDKSATGWNNLVFPNVGMPHALWQLSGSNRLASAEFDSHEKASAAANAMDGLVKVEPIAGGKWLVRSVAANPDAPGTMTPVEYKEFVADLVNFLDFVAEPSKNKRISLGIAVLLFFGLLFPLVYALKRQYWKDVH